MRCRYTETLTSIKRSPRGFFTSQKNAHVLRLLTTPSAHCSAHTAPLPSLLSSDNRHQTTKFHEALDTFGYEGDRQFTRRRRDVIREQTAYQTATQMYQHLEDTGVPERQRIREVGTLLDNQYSVQRINAWGKRWKEETQHQLYR